MTENTAFEPNEYMERATEDAKRRGLLVASTHRSPIKLRADAPKIAICIPMGDKDDPTIFQCPQCMKRQFGEIHCSTPGCEHVFDAGPKQRIAGMAPIEFTMNAQQLINPLLCSVVTMARKSVRSSRAREEMTYEAMKMGCKYIFYWDDDVLVPQNTLMDLYNMMELHPEAALISGVYVTRQEIPNPHIYKHHGEGPYWDFSIKPGTLESIFASGAGCLMARVSALQEVQQILGGKLWDEEHDEAMIQAEEDVTHITWGHDIRFCSRVRQAVNKGGTSQPWEVYVAGWLLCYHFDAQKQAAYGMPKEAPCFHNANTLSYWDRIWSEEGHDTQRMYTQLYERINELIQYGSNVIDFGCGVGVLMEMLTKKNHCDCYGLDISPKAIELLKERWLKGQPCDAKEWKAATQPFATGEAYFVCTETLEHLDDERMHNLLSEARYFKKALFSVPNGHLAGTPAGEHVQVFDSDSLTKTLRKYFRSVKVEDCGGRLLAVASGSKAARKSR